jgi:eukaryotic-like serine/threonine-protein kinase
MADVSPEQRVGQSLRGKYTLERLLGVGAMAAVYAARHRNGGTFAVKVLHASVGTQADLKMRFLREGYIANRIDHPNIVRIIDDDVDEATGSAFIVMELLDGMTLESEWQAGGRRLPPSRVVRIATLLLEVLEAAHGAGVVHRDIKPDNVFALRDGGIKVLDFGIARLMDASRQATGSGLMLGTPEFAAPEQAGGRVNEVGPRSDIYSVGALMFTLLTGEYVHRGRSSTEVMVLAATTPARSVLDIAPAIDPRLANVVDVALAFEIAGRWQNAPQMRRALGTVPVQSAAATTIGLSSGPRHPTPRMVPATVRASIHEEPEDAIPLVPNKRT